MGVQESSRLDGISARSPAQPPLPLPLPGARGPWLHLHLGLGQRRHQLRQLQLRRVHQQHLHPVGGQRLGQRPAALVQRSLLLHPHHHLQQQHQERGADRECPPGKAPGATAHLSLPCTWGGRGSLYSTACLKGMEGPGEQSLRERLLGLSHSGQPCPLLQEHGARSTLSPPGDHRPAPPLHQQARGHLRLGPAGCRNGRPRSGGQVGAGVATGLSPGCPQGASGARQDPVGTKRRDFALLAGWFGVQS